jgi:hypothetical protein
MNERQPSLIDRLSDLNARAEGYARIRLRDELQSSNDLRGRHLVKFGFALNFLRVYYVFSAPVVTIVSRSNLLMALVRILYAPTRRVVRCILS